MPYQWPNNIPDYIKGLPPEAQKIFVRVFNKALESGKTEDEARIVAWAAVKQKYKKVGDEWVLREMSFEEISPRTLKDVSNQELISLHRRAHQLWGRFFENGTRVLKPSGLSREDLINAHVFIVKEMLKRGMDHHIVDRLDKLSTPLLEAGVDFVLVPDYVSIVGSSVEDWASANDLDILIRQPQRDSSLEIKIMKTLGKDKDYHFIYDPRGPHDDYIPIFDLVLRAKKPTVRKVEAEVVKIDLGCDGRKPDGYIGVDKVLYDDVDILWDCENGLPFPDNYADEIRAWHFLEHIEDQDMIMKEIHRVLKPEGVLVFEVPSTKGEGAFVPGHKSYWNKTTFLFYTDPSIREPLFKIEELDEYSDNDHVYVRGKLRPIKMVQEALKPFSKFIPPKPAMAGFTEFFSTKELWDNWASKKIAKGLHIEIEEKLNGFRAIIRKKEDRVSIEFEDSQQDRSNVLPELVDDLKKVPGDLILDSNIGIDKDGKPLPRIKLMRLISKQPQLDKDEVVKATLFDIPYWNKDLTKEPLGRRREDLEEVYEKYLKGSPHFALTHWTPIYDEDDLERKAKKLASLPQSEGIVAKVVESTYPLDGSTADWAKIK
ncbi:MAG: ChaB family protein, partial [Candidatus Asgardarchaeia archaeon]